jgi:hypothetical protein
MGMGITERRTPIHVGSMYLRGDGEDSSTIVIVDVTTMEQVGIPKIQPIFAQLGGIW